MPIEGTNHSNQFACISVTPEGLMKKQFIQLSDDDFRLMPEYAFMDANNELYLMSIRTKKAFTVAHILNHATFHLAKISVN